MDADAASGAIEVEQRKFLITNFSELQIHPGKILLNEFLMTSEFNIIEWAKILFITTGELDSVLYGKKILTTTMIIKLSRIFNTDINYWIDLNNNFLSQLADSRYLEIFGKEG